MPSKKYIILMVIVAVTIVLTVIGVVVTKRSVNKINQSTPELSRSGIKNPSVQALARIGSKEITRADLERQLENLSSQVPITLANRADTLNFLRQYLGQELVHQAALQMGLDQDSVVLAQSREITKQLIMDRYLDLRLTGVASNPTPQEVQEFYQANRAQLGGMTLEKNRAEIEQILHQEHKGQAFQDMLDGLWSVSDIQIYEDSL